MISALLFAMLIHRHYRPFSIYALFISGTITASIIISLNTDIRVITSCYMMLIFISVIFFQFKLTLFVAALQLAAFVALLGFNRDFQSYLSPYDIGSVPILILIAVLLAHIVLVRGSELQLDLKQTLVAKQDLVIQNAIMDKLSKTDALTGLNNHIAFHHYFDKALQFTASGTTFHLAILDIDNFKVINDTYGHHNGDIILTRVAHTIRDNITANDVAARYGGEEFAILLFDQPFRAAYARLEAIRKQIVAIANPELDNRQVTVSIGMQSYSPGMNKETLFSNADQNLYEAKRTGKNKTIAAK